MSSHSSSCQKGQEIIIPLTQGRFTRISVDDEYVAQSRWHFNAREGYAQRTIGKKGNRRNVLLHREIVQGIIGRPLGNDEYVEHINKDKLDNRRENLLYPLNSSERGQRSKSGRNTSGYAGVFYDGKRNKWKAVITKNRRKKSLGYYATPEEAALAYNDAARENFGEKAWLNDIPVKKNDGGK